MLNSEQKKAVEHTEGPLLILAGAGAGKTHSLTERVAYMVKTLGIAPTSILCVTFTNKAAKEMRERIAKTLGKDIENLNMYRSSDFPLIGTFHALGVYFLRLFIDRIGYEKSFTILDEDDKLKIIKEILDEKGIDTKEINARQVVYGISTAKNLCINAKMYSYNVKSYFEEKVSEVFEVYEKRLKEMNVLDFDDILSKTSEILDIPEVLEYFQNGFQYFMVDEYQDTNETQYRIVNKLASKSKNICVVGDDWQGIYSWRGANIQNIFNFQKDYKDCKVVKLEQNYRSTKSIISGANSVIKNNIGILDKTLWTDNVEGEKINIIETFDEKQECEKVAEEIRDILDDREENIAVLYRTNGQSRLIEEALLYKGITYRVYGGVKFYERKEIKDILAYLRILANPNDVISLKRIINVPTRKIGAKSVQVLFNYARNYAVTPLDIMDNVDEITELTPLAKKGVATFNNIYKTLKEFALTNTVDNIMKHIVKLIDYEAYLLDEYGSEEYETKMDNVREFRNMASRYSGLEPTEALSLFLEDVALITDADTDKEGSSFKVSLMSIHLSKGLEFDNVFIVGAEEGLFPHSRSLLDTKQLEEERRLMYVAMTRAKKHLFISRASERFTFGSYSANPPSRFIREIPEELIERKQFQRTFANNLSFSTGFGTKFSFENSTEVTDNTPKIRTLIHNDPTSFALGDRVNHVKFGVGTIVSITGKMADIAWGGGYGIKKMNIEIAPLEKL
ncbi:MAG: 3'-5' exonuclease [Candidatus Gracilibacteria bacterium]|nr:3'-5' exonuclease [Candidatus Gracilibacteria bacterium]MDD2908668.1 3'-5' exonuclease [Candidatus Gracilibacteria bacterium]